MANVVACDEFTAWYEAIDEGDFLAVNRYVDLLEAQGVTLDHPYSSKIVGSTINMRELRVQSGGRPLRVFCVFDPARQAVLLIGGDKTGDDRFYERMTPIAERIYGDYVKRTPKE